MRQLISRQFPGFVRWLNSTRLPEMAKRVEPALRPGDRVLDVGPGHCLFVELLRNRGVDVTPLDVVNATSVPEIVPQLYDGRTMPFDDRTFDVALIMFVLHHTPDPDSVLRETARVARRVIVFEDLLDGRWHGAYTKFMDSALNLEFFGHPHTNRTDAQWRTTFTSLGLRVERADRYCSMGFRHGVYYLEHADAASISDQAGKNAVAPAVNAD